MALFEITPKEQSDVNLWLRSINREVQSHTLARSTFYDFNFVKGDPSAKTKRFEWLSDDEKNTEEEFTTRPTIDQNAPNQNEYQSFFESIEDIDQIPDIASENIQL